jgi:hypothetical protein
VHRSSMFRRVSRSIDRLTFVPDASSCLFTTIFRSQGYDHDWTLLSNRSISCLWCGHVELVSIRALTSLNRNHVCSSRVMWFAGGLAALSSVTYPSISAFLSVYAKENQQGETNLLGQNRLTFFRTVQDSSKEWSMVFGDFAMVSVQPCLDSSSIYSMSI